jgi:RNA polymerase sigma factor (sigma-70 family)
VRSVRQSRRRDRSSSDGPRLQGDALTPDTAFASFFRAEYPSVVRTIALLLHDPSAAEDIAQEAFVRLHLRWSKVSGYDRPDAWVRRVALNLAATHARREGRRRGLEHHSVRRSLATVLMDHSEPDSRSSSVALQRALQTLSSRQRALVILYYYEDRPLSQAGELVGLTPGSAKVALHRARRRLKRALSDPGAASHIRAEDAGRSGDDV